MKDSNINDEPIRSHEYDGIQEYDNKLPNWWLFTLYGAIAFSVAYWIYYHKSDVGMDQEEEYQAAVAALEAQLASSSASGEGGAAAGAELDDAALWTMSLKEKDVEAGRQVYSTMCASCHGLSLEGAIGVNLVDGEWIHGSNPLAIRSIVSNGFMEKGMPPWLPVIGDKKVNQVTAFILSHHQQP